MKMKKFLALSTASVMALSMVACGNTDNGASDYCIADVSSN